jgi:hypothetical protein
MAHVVAEAEAVLQRSEQAVVVVGPAEQVFNLSTYPETRVASPSLLGSLRARLSQSVGKWRNSS